MKGAKGSQDHLRAQEGGHTNQHPHMKGAKGGQANAHHHVKEAKGSQDHFRAQEGGHTNQHPPSHEGSRGVKEAKTISKPEKAGTPTNTRPHMKGEGGHTNQHPPPHEGSQRESRPLQNPRRRPHQPTTTPLQGSQRELKPFQSPRRRPHQTPIRSTPTWREPKGAKTTSEPKKAATPTNTYPHTKGAKGSQDHFRAQEGGHTNQHPLPHEGSQRESKGVKTTSEPKKAATPTNTKAARSKVALRTPRVNCSCSPFGSDQRQPRLVLDNVKHQPIQIRNKTISLIYRKNTLQRVLNGKLSNHTDKFMNILQGDVRNAKTNASTSNTWPKCPTGLAVRCTSTRYHLCIDFLLKLFDSIQEESNTLRNVSQW